MNPLNKVRNVQREFLESVLASCESNCTQFPPVKPQFPPAFPLCEQQSSFSEVNREVLFLNVFAMLCGTRSFA
jgi:hypothetical protein